MIKAGQNFARSYFLFTAMKRNYRYFVLLFFLFSFTLLIVTHRKPEETFVLKLRQGEQVASSDWLNTKAAIEDLIERVRLHSTDNKAKLALGMAYIRESRISGNHSYYDKAALNLFD